MPDQPLDCWNLLDIIWPGRFGKAGVKDDTGKTTNRTPYSFAARYANKEIVRFNTRFGEETRTKFVGVNARHAEELQARLSACSSRTTKAEVAHLLPAFHVIPLPMAVGPKPEPWMYFGETNERTISQANALVSKLTSLSSLEEASEGTLRCFLGHRKEVVSHISSATGAVYITGDTPNNVRYKRLQEASRDKQDIACTIDAVGIGIDLTAWTEVYIVEMHYRPELMIQALGRFSRLSGRQPATVYLMIAEGTEDEVIARRLMNKLDAINKLVKAGDADEKLLAALGGGKTDAETLQSLADYVNSLGEGGELVL